MQSFRQGINRLTHLSLQKTRFYSSSTSEMSFYAVARGRKVGIYKTWDECNEQVKGFSGAKFKKFKLSEEAEKFIADGKESETSKSKTQDAKTEIKEEKPNSLPIIKMEVSCSTNAVSQARDVSTTDIEIERKLTIDDEGYVHVYTDGACSMNGRTGARAGVGVWFQNDHPLNVSEAVIGPPTNNVAEIEAACRAIEVAKQAGIPKLQINTDSEFLIKCVTLWLPKWMENEWKLSSGGKVKNQVQLERLNSLMNDINLKWVHVRGHQGIDGNEQADELARKGAEKYLTSSAQRFKPY